MGLLDKARNVHEIIWTNRFDCPDGYEFNDDGWVETMTAFPKISVSLLPHLSTKIGEYQLLFQNFLALKFLNNLPDNILKAALWNRATQAMLGRNPSVDVFEDAVSAAIKITNGSKFPVFSDDIFKMDTIWYSKECKEAGRSAIKQKIRNKYISDVRSFMPIYTKYKTKDVMQEAELSKYAVGLYWKNQCLPAAARTVAALTEAYTELNDEGEELTLATLAQRAGISSRSLQRYKTQLKLV